MQLLIVRRHGGDAERAQLHALSVARPYDRAVVGGVARVGELHEQAILDRPARDAAAQVVEQVVGPQLRRDQRVEVGDSGDGQDLVSAGSPGPCTVDEDECVVPEIAEGGEALGRRFVVGDELERARVAAEELLDRRRVRARGGGGGDGLEQRQEIVPRADQEPVVRDGDDVGEGAAPQREPDRHPTGRGMRVVIVDLRDAGTIGQPDGDRHGGAVQVGRTADRGRAGGRGERPGQDEPLGVRKAKAWVNAAVDLHHGVGDLLRQTFVLRRERWGEAGEDPQHDDGKPVLREHSPCSPT